MATLDELRLQQLLSPFNNQGNNTGITSINQKYMDPRYTYDGLYQENYGNYDERMDPNKDPYGYLYGTGTRQASESSAFPFNVFGTESTFNPRAGIPQINNQVPQINNQVSQINNQVPLGFDTSYGVANEEDEEQEYLPGQRKKLSDMGRNFGISSLIGMITGNPIIGLLSEGARGIGNLNDKMQNSMFGKSKTLAEYFNNRKIAAATGSKDFMNRPRSERNFTGPSGNDNTGGGPGSRGASDSFSNKSGMGRTGY